MKRSMLFFGFIAVVAMIVSSCSSEKKEPVEQVKKVAPAPKPIDAKSVALVSKTELLKNVRYEGIPVHKRVYQEMEDVYEYNEFLPILWDIPLDVWDVDGYHISYPEQIQPKNGGWDIAIASYGPGDKFYLKERPIGYTWFEDSTGKKIGKRTYIKSDGTEWKLRK